MNAAITLGNSLPSPSSSSHFRAIHVIPSNAISVKSAKRFSIFLGERISCIFYSTLRLEIGTQGDFKVFIIAQDYAVIICLSVNPVKVPKLKSNLVGDTRSIGQSAKIFFCNLALANKQISKKNLRSQPIQSDPKLPLINNANLVIVKCCHKHILKWK